MTTAHDLASRLADLLSREHAAMADFLVALAAFDQGRHWERLGHANLFAFLHRDLGLSKGAAHYRKVAAELVQRYPEVVEPLRDGRLCFSSILEVAKVITPENRGEVLPRFFHRSRREAMEVAAELRPATAVPRRDVVTTVRTAARVEPALQLAPPPKEISAQPLRGEVGGEPQLPVHPGEPLAPAVGAAPSPAARDTVTPLTADLSRLRITVSRRFLRKLEAARMALSHSHPGASTEEILDVALDLLLERDAKRKGLVAKPRKEPRPTTTDHVPAAVRREIWQRDGGKCQWKLASGELCGSTLRVQLDHIVPRALGGPSTVSNLRCLCASHNLLAARNVLGDALMDRYAGSRRNAAPGEQASPSP